MGSKRTALVVLLGAAVAAACTPAAPTQAPAAPSNSPLIEPACASKLRQHLSTLSAGDRATEIPLARTDAITAILREPCLSSLGIDLVNEVTLASRSNWLRAGGWAWINFLALDGEQVVLPPTPAPNLGERSPLRCAEGQAESEVVARLRSEAAASLRLEAYELGAWHSDVVDSVTTIGTKDRGLAQRCSGGADRPACVDEQRDREAMIPTEPMCLVPVHLELKIPGRKSTRRAEWTFDPAVLAQWPETSSRDWAVTRAVFFALLRPQLRVGHSEGDTVPRDYLGARVLEASSVRLASFEPRVRVGTSRTIIYRVQVAETVIEDICELRVASTLGSRPVCDALEELLALEP